MLTFQNNVAIITNVLKLTFLLLHRRYNMSREQENLAKQKYLKSGGTIFFISLMAAFIPLSTDLYLPALNDMCEVFDAS